MYKRILVTLDGSNLGESVLPHVVEISRGCQVVDVRLIRVVEPVEFVLAPDPTIREEEQQRMESSDKKHAELYLVKIANKLKEEGINAQSEVLYGKVADSIIDYVNKNEIDLVVMATHGRSGVSRWAWGSITDRILRTSCSPVLLVRAPGCVPGVY